MEETNPRLRKQLIQVVNNQLNANNPTETRLTLERLKSDGYSETEAKELIAAVLSNHIYDILSEQHKLDTEKYIRDLKNLPDLPWE